MHSKKSWFGHDWHGIPPKTFKLPDKHDMLKHGILTPGLKGGIVTVDTQCCKCNLFGSYGLLTGDIFTYPELSEAPGRVNPYATHTSRQRVVSKDDTKRLFDAVDFAQCAGEDDALKGVEGDKILSGIYDDRNKIRAEVRAKYNIAEGWGINRDGSLEPPRVT